MADKKKSAVGVLGILVYAMMIIAVIYVLVQAILGNNGTLAFKLILGVWILAAIVIMDFVEPMAGHRFDSLPAASLKWYIMYAVMDGAMYMCLYVFVINVSMVREPVHYLFLPAMILFLVMRIIFFNKYKASAEAVLEASDASGDIRDIDTVSAGTPDDDEGLKEMIYRERNK